MIRYRRSIELAVLALAALLRVAGILSLEATPYADAPLVDAYTYWDQARQIVADRDPFEGGYYQPPAYPYLLSLVFDATGETALGPVRWLQAGLGLATVGLLLRLGRALAPWAGVLAALLYTLYPTALLFEQDLLTPALTSFLLCASLALSGLRGADAEASEPPEGEPGAPDSAAPAPAAGRAGLAGLLAGAAASLHPTYLIACGALLLPLRRSRRAALALILGVGLALAPTAVSNYARWGEVALVSHNTGINFYLGNNPDWKRTSALKPGLPFRQLALESDPHLRDTFARNTYWLERTWSEIGLAPLGWLRTLGTKLWWSLNGEEIPRNEDYRCRTERPSMVWLGALPVRWALVFPLAVVGVGAALRRRRPTLPLLWLALHLPMILFLVADRYRLATWPVVVLLAGWGGHALIARIRAIQSGDRLRPAAAVALALAIWIPWGPIDDQTSFQPSWCLHQRANFAWNDEDYATAEALYRATVAMDPSDWSARSWQAQALLRLDRPAEAAAVLAPLVEDFPNSHPTQMLISKAYQQAGDLDRAADHMGLAYQVPGPRTNTGARYVDLLLRADRLDEARAVVEADTSLQRSKKVRESFERYKASKQR